MKKIKLNQEILGIDGKVVSSRVKVKTMEEIEGELIEKESLEDKVLTVEMMLKQALLKRDVEITEEELLSRCDLVDKIMDKEECEMDEKEIEFLKKLVINRFDVFFAGQLVRILNK